MHRILLITFLFPCIAFAVNKKTTVKDCHTEAKGECFTFKGRARHYSGYASTRIWKVGSNRMYVVTHQSEKTYKDLNQVSFATQLFADFDACAMKAEATGGMQEICVQEIHNAKMTPMPE